MKNTFKGLLIALVALSLAACGAKPDGDKDKASNVVTFAKKNDVISMDSRYATDGMLFEIITATVEGLMSMDKDGNIFYALAECHTVSDDQLTWTFKLKDATWDNGTAVNADDFVYAWQATITSPDAAYEDANDFPRLHGFIKPKEKSVGYHCARS